MEKKTSVEPSIEIITPNYVKGNLPDKAKRFMVYKEIEPGKQEVHINDYRIPGLTPRALCGVNDPKKFDASYEFKLRGHYTTSHPVVTCLECIGKMAMIQASGEAKDFYADELKLALDLYKGNTVAWIVTFQDTEKEPFVCKTVCSGIGEPSSKEFGSLLQMIEYHLHQNYDSPANIDEVKHIHRAIFTDGYDAVPTVTFKNANSTEYCAQCGDRYCGKEGYGDCSSM